jgi:hypothetical protein
MYQYASLMYQPITSMTNYLTIANASSTYQTLTCNISLTYTNNAISINIINTAYITYKTYISYQLVYRYD